MHAFIHEGMHAPIHLFSSSRSRLPLNWFRLSVASAVKMGIDIFTWTFNRLLSNISTWLDRLNCPLPRKPTADLHVCGSKPTWHGSDGALTEQKTHSLPHSHRASHCLLNSYFASFDSLVTGPEPSWTTLWTTSLIRRKFMRPCVLFSVAL